MQLELYLTYLSLAMQSLLAVTAGYGFIKARVRYFKVGMFFLFLGFILSLIDYSARFGLVFRSDIKVSIIFTSNVILFIGLITLTWYRERLGL